MTAASDGGGDAHDAGSLAAHAFGLLVSAELGRWPEWNGPADGRALRARVEALTLLFDLLPRSELCNLDKVMAVWKREFPDPRPVSATKLRASARTILSAEKGNKAASRKRDELFQRAAALVRLRGIDVTPVPVRVSAAAGTDAKARSQCAQGLATWLELTTTDERWTHLPAAVPGQAAMDMRQVYVELNVIPTEDLRADAIAQITKLQRTPRQRLTSEYGVMSAASIVARSVERCIVIGEPGSGKSTLMQWLSWAASQRLLPDFDAALFVALSGFVAALEKQPDISILEYFFQSLAGKPANWRPAAGWMRRVASESQRYLLLLDGWDEVPVARRDTVRRRMAEEETCFVIVITSRPSGLPLQLLTTSSVELCGIAPLRETAVEELVDKLLMVSGKTERRQAILKRIEEHAGFRETAGNPFLLGLLVGILSQATDPESGPRTVAQVYQQVIGWLVDQYNQTPGRTEALTMAHLNGLRRLSRGLLFEGDLPRYVFGTGELAECLKNVAIEPVLQSRFLNRIDLMCDEHSFLHATFQEFFAAAAATTLADDAMDQFLDRAFYSLSRLIVLEFAAGMGGRISKRCRTRAAHWLKHRDRYLQTSLRISKLVAAGRWASDRWDESCRIVKEELWQVIVSDDDMELTKLAVEAFAAVDAADLCRRAVRHKGVPTWALNCMAATVPPSVARRERLDTLLPGEWETFAGIEVRGGASLQEIEAIRSTLADKTLPAEDRREAAIRAGSARDPGAVPLLIGILSSGAADRGLLEQAIFSLGVIGGRVAADALISIVLAERPLAVELVRIAVGGLRHVATGRKALDPVGRDRLVRRLAALAPESPCVTHILWALEGFPVRDGAAVIAEIAHDERLEPELRMQAIRVLATAPERAMLQQSVSSIGSEPDGAVALSWLTVAAQRGLSAPLQWLEDAIKRCRDRMKLHQMVKTLVLVLPNASPADRRKGTKFLHGLIAESMKANAPEEDDRAKALVQALSAAGYSGKPYLSEDTFELARFALTQFAESPSTVSEGCVLLAAAVLAHFSRPASGLALHKALDAALQMDTPQNRTRQDLDRLPTALANSLAVVAPGALLGYSAGCAVVERVLRSHALRNGWMVFADRITDAEGVEIARRGAGDATSGQTAPLGLSDLVKALPPALRCHLESYLVMVGPGGPCLPTNSLRAIHTALLHHWQEESHDSPGEELGRLYPDRRPNPGEALGHIYPERPPTFEAWKRALNRIEKRFKGQPEAEAILRHYGLYRREGE